MRGLRALLFRLGSGFARARRERELAEELASHLEMQIEDNLRAGMSPEEARRTALVKSGGLENAKEACRERWALPLIEISIRDLRHTLRLLFRNPAFTITAVLSLALGIGANTTVFTLLDRLLLRTLPVSHPEQLVMLWTNGPSFGSSQGTRSSSYPMYQDFQRRADAFTQVFCRYYTPVSVTIGKSAERVMGELVSGNYFQALGVGPALGRVFSPEEDDRVYKGHPVVVLSYPYWVSRFGRDPGVIGQKILVNNYPMTIVGVSAASFSGMDPVRSPQIRIPIQMKPLMTPASDNLGDRRRQWVQIFARLKPGYTLESARASLQPLLSQILQAEAEMPALRDIPRPILSRFLARKVLAESVANGYSDLQKTYSTALVALMSMVGLVLLIACFNVASLLIARATARQRELAMRLAIGASRGQLVRQALVESAVLCAAGAGAGLMLSIVMVRGILGFLPSNGMLSTLQPEPDWRILGFTAALACATVLLFVPAPARHALKLDIWPALVGSPGGSHRPARFRRALVTAQITLSFLLVAGALLFARTLFNLEQADSGFRDIDRVVSFQIDPARSGYSLPRLKAFYEQTLENIRALPETRSAGYAWIEVMAGRFASWDIAAEGVPVDPRNREAYVNGVSPGFWRTMGIPLLEGCDFSSGDSDGRPKVAIVNRKFASDFFAGASPVGRRIGLDTGPNARPNVEIVGVVENSMDNGPRDGVRRQVFFPFPQMNQPVGVAFYVRTSAGPGRIFPALRQTVGALDASVPVYQLKTLENQLDETLGKERLNALLSTAFGVLATLLAAVGIYGVMTLTVARRTREIGLRMAVGAPRSAVLRMVLQEAFGLTAIGLTVGMPGAWLLSRYVSSQLFGVAPADPATGAAAAVILAAVAAIASVLPARRATMIDPAQALRRD